MLSNNENKKKNIINNIDNKKPRENYKKKKVKGKNKDINNKDKIESKTNNKSGKKEAFKKTTIKLKNNKDTNKNQQLEEKNKRQLFKKSDILIIGFIVFVSVFIVFLFASKYNSYNEELAAVIKKDGKVVEYIEFNKVEEPFYLNLKENPNIKFLVEEDGISFINSTCKDKLCIKYGKLTKQGQYAVCLPEQVSVTIEPKEYNIQTKEKIDGVAS